ncbi:MAG: hypothetical protein ACJ0HC_04210 [Gammaproteobacteria bacterium]|tara:strand:- start:131 stop:574 length:444 start_codon:yes stop_codon:yes gene_type:complete
MKPDINIALMNAAQEIINRFSPLIEDEYEKSRLGSWGALILISAMRFNDAASELKKENIEIADWLTSNTKVGKEDLEKSINLSTSEDNIDRLDQQNQILRGLLNEEIERLEVVDDKSVLLDGYSLMRSMHQRRKVSDLIGLLQQSED